MLPYLDSRQTACINEVYVSVSLFVCLFVCGLFNGAVSTSDCMTSRDGTAPHFPGGGGLKVTIKNLRIEEVWGL